MQVNTKKQIGPFEILFEPVDTHREFQQQMTAIYDWKDKDNTIAILNVEDKPYNIKQGDIIGHLYMHSMLPSQETAEQVLTLEKSGSSQEEKETTDKLLKDLQITDNEVLTPYIKEQLADLII